MRSSFLLIGCMAVLLAIAIAACTNSSANTANAPAKADSAARVLRGAYLVNAIGCDDCHSPKRMGAHGPEIIPELRLSGFPHDGKLPPINTDEVKKGWAMLSPDLTSAVGPWGISYAGNLTSDATGIGNWKEENFIRALREGKFKGLPNGRSLLPPMPWYNFAKLTDEDLKAMFAYLKTTKPVKNTVPAPKPLDELH